MLNSHLEAKPFPFAEPEAFRSFFADRLPLVLLEKYTYENTETLTAPVRIANYGKSGLRGDVCCELSGKDFRRQIILPDVYCPQGELIDDSHPLFRNFPTEFHTNWQWWPMAVQRAVILPEAVSAIITEMDSYAWLRADGAAV